MQPNEKVLVQATAIHLAHWVGPVLVHWENEEWERCICGQEEGTPVIWSDAAQIWMGLEDAASSTVYLDLGIPECFDRVARVLAEQHGLDTSDGVMWSRRSRDSWTLRVAPPRGMHAGSPAFDSYERRFVPKLMQAQERLKKERRGYFNLWVQVPELATSESSARALALCASGGKR